MYIWTIFTSWKSSSNHQHPSRTQLKKICDETWDVWVLLHNTVIHFGLCAQTEQMLRLMRTVFSTGSLYTGIVWKCHFYFSFLNPGGKGNLNQSAYGTLWDETMGCTVRGTKRKEGEESPPSGGRSKHPTVCSWNDGHFLEGLHERRGFIQLCTIFLCSREKL